MSTLSEQVPAVVVGLDGTAASAAALAWASAEAQAHRCPLIVVHVLDPRYTPAVYSPTRPEASQDADGVLARIKELVELSTTGPVEQVFEVGVPAQVLVHRARGARALVLGHGARHRAPAGQEYRHGPVLGTIGRACVARAECPVVVVPEPVVGRAAKAVGEPAHRAPVQGARAVYPFQDRIPVAHR